MANKPESGDLLLCFPKPDSGADEPSMTTLPVSSTVLSLASPVFSVMLNGPMAEGQAFRAPDSPRPFPLTLPEDDPAAFLILANVIHYHADRIPYLPSCAELLGLAKLVDKYDCSAVIAAHMEVWLRRAMLVGATSINTPGPGPVGGTKYSAPFEVQEQDDDYDEEREKKSEYRSLQGRCTLLLVAYILDMAEEFSKLSSAILLMHRQNVLSEINGGLEIPIPADHELLRGELLRQNHDLLGEFLKRKNFLRHSVQTLLMSPVTAVYSFLEQNTTCRAFGSMVRVPPTCPSAMKIIGRYMTLLHENNLCPWRSQFETDNFGAILQRAKDVVKRERHNPGWKFQKCEKPSSSADYCVCAGISDDRRATHMVETLADGIEDPVLWRMGPCLDCMTRGELSDDGDEPMPCRRECTGTLRRHWIRNGSVLTVQSARPPPT
ncbi:hypothetical protein V8F20_004026 [Naviculisporaceae sp. PSN 640]